MLCDNLDILFGAVSDLISCPFVSEVVFFLLTVRILDTIALLVNVPPISFPTPWLVFFFLWWHLLLNISS